MDQHFSMDTPPMRLLKCNIDVSSNDKSGPSGIGDVLRDHEGNFLCIFSCPTHIKNQTWMEFWQFEKLFN